MWSLPNIRDEKLDRASGLPLKHVHSHLLCAIIVYPLCLFWGGVPWTPLILMKVLDFISERYLNASKYIGFQREPNILR